MSCSNCGKFNLGETFSFSTCYTLIDCEHDLTKLCQRCCLELGYKTEVTEEDQKNDNDHEERYGVLYMEKLYMEKLYGIIDWSDWSK